MKHIISFAVKNIDFGLGGKYTMSEDLDVFEIEVDISKKQIDRLESFMNKDYRLEPRINEQIIEFRGID